MSETPVNEVSNELWPDDKFLDGRAPGTSHLENSEPDVQLAVWLLAAGCTHSVVKTRAGFESVKDVQALAKENSKRQGNEEQGKDRARRVGKRALVKLEQLLAKDHTDLRATVL